LSKYTLPGLQLEICSLESLEHMLLSTSVIFYGASEENNIVDKHVAFSSYQVTEYYIHKALENIGRIA